MQEVVHSPSPSTPRAQTFFESFSPAFAAVAIVVICCFVIQKNRDTLAEQTPLTVFIGVVLINALGFFIGGLLGKLYRLSRAQRVTLAIEIGMQNAGMGVVLATSTFKDKPSVPIPATLFAIWCILTAAVLIAFLKRVGRNADKWLTTGNR